MDKQSFLNPSYDLFTDFSKVYKKSALWITEKARPLKGNLGYFEGYFKAY